MRHSFKKIITQDFATGVSTLFRCKNCGKWKREKAYGVLRKTVRFGHSPFPVKAIPGECSKIETNVNDIVSKEWVNAKNGDKIKFAHLKEVYLLDHWNEWINIADKAPLLHAYRASPELPFIIDAAQLVFNSLSPNAIYLTAEQKAIKEVIE